MNNREIVVVIKNGLANVLRGSSSALLAVVVPPFLVARMTPPAYGAWALILAMAAYVGYLDAGIQTALARFVAHANEDQNSDWRDSVISTAVALLIGAGAVGSFLIVGLAFSTGVFFKHMPSDLVPQVRTAVLLVGCSLAVGLPANFVNGVFVGLQRNELPALITASSRAVTGVALVVVVAMSGSLVDMAMAVALINLMTYAFQFAVYRRTARGFMLRLKFVRTAVAREVVSFCGSISVWTIGMLLVAGVDTVLVGLVEYKKVAAYALAATLVSFIAGIQNALFSSLIPNSAVLCARGAREELGSTLVASTRYSVVVLMTTAIPLCFGAKELLRLWVGPQYATDGTGILILLVIANVIRLVGTPYAVLLIGTGELRLAIWTPIAEGVINLGVSIIAGLRFGANGVAIGTLVGSVVSILGHVLYNMKRTTGIAVSRAEFVNNGIVRPLLGSTLSISLICFGLVVGSGPVRMFAFVAAGVVYPFTAWMWALTAADRTFLRVTGERLFAIGAQLLGCSRVRPACLPGE